MAGIPIRLVRRDGKLIHLNCQNYILEMDRSILVVPVPITAERFGADFNMVSSRIQMECVLVDDDCTTTDFAVSYATAIIDFSVKQEKVDGSTSGTAQSGWMFSDGGVVAAIFLDGAYFSLISTPASAGADGTEFRIIFDSSTTTPTVSGNDITVGIDALGGAPPTDSAEELVTRIKAALDNFPAFLAKFDVAVQAGDNANQTGNTAMVFTQKVGGSLGATAGPTLEDAGTLVTTIPRISDFTHVSDTGCRSAGDKAQNLLATVANNSVLGVMGRIGAGETGIPLPSEGLNLDYFYKKEHSDYIIGLQLPYNSLAQASLSDVGDPVAGYNVRNFIVVTGAGKRDKGAESNREVAGIDFNFRDKYTGISGTVTSCKLNYEAGETIYSATIVFQPLDFLTGIG